MKKISWGIIGAGKIAAKFAQDIQYTSHAELSAVASRSAENANNFAIRHGIPKAYGSYEDLYADKEIDAVYVATPHPFHFKNVSDALNSGKAVLCEKPITMNPDECEDLISLAKKKDKYLMEAMWTYFLPAIHKAIEWVSSGKIGKIRHIKSSFGFSLPFQPGHRAYNPELGGGSILDIGIYCIALTWLFYKKNPENITVIAQKTSENIDTDVLAILDYGDCTSVIHSSFNCKLPDSAFIIGEEGYIEIPEFWRATECLLYKEKIMTDHFTEHRQANGLNYEIEAASLDILNNRKESAVVPLNTSLEFQKMMENILKKID